MFALTRKIMYNNMYICSGEGRYVKKNFIINARFGCANRVARGVKYHNAPGGISAKFCKIYIKFNGHSFSRTIQ
jgi:hypothetical protein